MTAQGATPIHSTASADKGFTRRERLLGILRRRGAVAVLFLVVAVASLTFDGFLTMRNLENVLLQGALLGLIAVGMTVIISGGIDLSVGSLLALGGVLAGLTVGVSWPLALVAPVLACGLIGLGQGLLIAKAKMAPLSLLW